MREKRRGAYHLARTFAAVLQLAEASRKHKLWAIIQHDRAGHFHTPTQRQAVIEAAKRVAAALPHLAQLPRNLAKVHPRYGEPREERAVARALGGTVAPRHEQDGENLSDSEAGNGQHTG
jgi:hypothetical protein